LFIPYLHHFWADLDVLRLIRKPTDPSRIHSCNALEPAFVTEGPAFPVMFTKEP
jgi:hypothetical protein